MRTQLVVLLVLWADLQPLISLWSSVWLVLTVIAMAAMAVLVVRIVRVLIHPRKNRPPTPGVMVRGGTP